MSGTVWDDGAVLEALDNLLVKSLADVSYLMDALYPHSNETAQWGMLFLAGKFVTHYNYARQQGETDIQLCIRYALNVVMTDPTAHYIVGLMVENGVRKR